MANNGGGGCARRCEWGFLFVFTDHWLLLSFVLSLTSILRRYLTCTSGACCDCPSSVTWFVFLPFDHFQLRSHSPVFIFIPVCGNSLYPPEDRFSTHPTTLQGLLEARSITSGGTKSPPRLPLFYIYDTLGYISMTYRNKYKLLC